jgi:hypothetical protein
LPTNSRSSPSGDRLISEQQIGGKTFLQLARNSARKTRAAFASNLKVFH